MRERNGHSQFSTGTLIGINNPKDGQLQKREGLFHGSTSVFIVVTGDMSVQRYQYRDTPSFLRMISLDQSLLIFFLERPGKTRRASYSLPIFTNPCYRQQEHLPCHTVKARGNRWDHQDKDGMTNTSRKTMPFILHKTNLFCSGERASERKTEILLSSERLVRRLDYPHLPLICSTHKTNNNKRQFTPIVTTTQSIKMKSTTNILLAVFFVLALALEHIPIIDASNEANGKKEKRTISNPSPPQSNLLSLTHSLFLS